MRALAIALLIAVLAPAAGAAVPTTSSYQGKLEVDGQPFTGSADFKFAILCEAATLWSNDGTSVDGSEPTDPVNLEVVDGIFSVLLGDPALAMLPITAEPLGGCATPMLRVWVDAGDGVELLDDQPLASSPYALMAESATGAHGLFEVDGGLGCGVLVKEGGSVTALDAVGQIVAYMKGRTGEIYCETLKFSDGTSMTSATPGLQTHYYSPHLSAFRPMASTMSYAGSLLELRGSSINQALTFAAPVDLPDGAIITELRAYLRDYSSVRDLAVEFYPSALGAPGVLQSALAFVVSNAQPGDTVLSAAVANHVVDNATYSYFLSAGWFTPSPATDIALYAVRITYLAP